MGRSALFLGLICLSLILWASLALAATPHRLPPGWGDRVDYKVWDELKNHGRVPVSIVLSERLIHNDWKVDSRNSADQLRHIRAVEEQFLKLMPRQEFTPGYQIQTVYGIFGEISQSGIERALKLGLVERIQRQQIYSLNLLEGVPLIRGDVLHSLGYTGEGLTVAVIDSGIDYTHPALGGCFGPECKVIAGYDFISYDPNPMDVQSHGTAVAGIIASNDQIYQGMAPAANLAALRVCDSWGYCYDESIVAALDWVALNQVKYTIVAVNMSLGTGDTYTDPYSYPCSGTNEANMVKKLYDQGIAVVIASGNSYSKTGISSPACIPEAISVAAVYDAELGRADWSGCTDEQTYPDLVNCYANTGPILDLLAPSWQATTLNAGGGFRTFAGTSASAPYAAGAVALVYDYIEQESGHMPTPEGVRSRLKMTGDPVTDPANGLTFPRINLQRAISECPDNDGDKISVCDGDCNDNDPTIKPWGIDICNDGIDNNCNDFIDETCPDNYEPDNDPASAKEIAVNGASATHTLYPENDVDWIRFSGRLDFKYTIKTSFLKFGADTFIRLYRADGKTLIAEDDNSGVGYESKIDWIADANASYLIAVSHAKSEQTGTYAIDLTGIECRNSDNDPVPMCEGDCNDNDPTVYPDAFEICNDGKDNDCDGVTDGPCPDSFEPDETFNQARNLPADATEQNHTFSPLNDIDWIKFQGQKDYIYTIATSKLDFNTDTIIELFGPDGITSLERNDDAGDVGFNSLIEWICSEEAIYFVRIVNAKESTGEYTITLRAEACADKDHDGVNRCAGDCDDGDPLTNPTAVERCFDKKDNNCDGTVDENCEYADPYEPDNSPDESVLIENGNLQDHTFAPLQDEDWLWFEVTPDMGYMIETSDLDNIDTFLELYAADGTTLLRANNNIDDTSVASRLVWRASEEGILYIRVGNKLANNLGIYSITLTAEECLDTDGDGYGPCEGDCNDRNPDMYPNNKENCDDARDNDCNGQVNEYCYRGDKYEIDNTPQTAGAITTDGTSQEHSLVPGSDVDWYRFNAQQGLGYQMKIVQIRPVIVPVLTIYASDGETKIVTMGDTENSNIDAIWVATGTGTFYAKIENARNIYNGLYAFQILEFPCEDKDNDQATRCQGDCNDLDPWINPNLIEQCGDNKDNNCNGEVDEYCKYLDNYEPDNLAGNAKPLTIDAKAQTHSIAPQGDSDWLSFQPQANQWYLVVMTNMAEAAPFFVSICDAHGENCGVVIQANVGELPVRAKWLAVDGEVHTMKVTSSEFVESYGVALLITDCHDQDSDGQAACDGDCNDHDAAIHAGVVEVCGDDIDNNCNDLIDEDCRLYDRFEPDDVPADASDMKVNGVPERHTITPIGDVDWIKFPAKAKYRYTIETFDYRGAADIGISVYDEAAQNELASAGHRFLHDATLAWDCNADGTYYLELYDLEFRFLDDGINETGGYSIKISEASCIDLDGDGYAPCTGDCDEKNSDVNPGEFELCGDGIDNNCDGKVDDLCFIVDKYEPDNTFEEAKPIVGDGDAQNHTISPAGDVDFMSIAVKQNKFYVMKTFNVYGSYTTMTLYDSQRKKIAEDNSGDEWNSSFLSLRAVADDTYYLKIEGGDRVMVEYSIGITTSDCYDNDRDGSFTCDGDCDDTNREINPKVKEVCQDGIDNNCSGLIDEDCLDAWEPNDRPIQATTISTDGKGLPATIYPAGDSDWYSFQGQRGHVYNITSQDLIQNSSSISFRLYAENGEVLLGTSEYEYRPDNYQIARLLWTCQANGEYFIQVLNVDRDKGTGNYLLTVNDETPASTKPCGLVNPTAQSSNTGAQLMAVMFGLPLALLIRRRLARKHQA
jgi:hypothetical protein